MKNRRTSGGFYKDLDAAREKSGSCNCVTFVILFALIFILIEIIVFSFFKNLKSPPNFEGSSNSSVQITNNFSKVDLGEGNAQLSLSQGQLCSAMPQNLNCLISKDGIVISGKVSLFLPQNASVFIMPKVKDEKVSFEISKCTIGKLNAPKFFSYSIAQALNKSLSKQIPELENSKVQDVELEEGVMLISAKPK